MPEHCKTFDTIDSYRKFYIEDKKDFAHWTTRLGPLWFYEKTKNIFITDNMILFNNDLIVLTESIQNEIDNISSRRIKNVEEKVKKKFREMAFNLGHKNCKSVHLLEQLTDNIFCSIDGFEYNLQPYFSLI